MGAAVCACEVAPPIIRRGALHCGACGARLVVAAEVEEIFTTHRNPAKNADAFNRACRAGRVRGAWKDGRTWCCSATAWRERERPPAPRVRPKGAPARAPAKPTKPTPAVLARLGGERRRA